MPKFQPKPHIMEDVSLRQLVFCLSHLGIRWIQFGEPLDEFHQQGRIWPKLRSAVTLIERFTRFNAQKVEAWPS